MKVVCESCQTRYAIADEKVRGKTFKIRCKKCGASMVVRSAAMEAAAPAELAKESVGAGAGDAADADDDLEKETRVFNYAEFERLMADKPDDGAPAAVAPAQRGAESQVAEWYLLIGEEQVGPLALADVEQRVRQGEATGETFAWREGLADWRPMSEVEALAPLLIAASRAPAFDEEATRAELPSALAAPAPVAPSSVVPSPAEAFAAPSAATPSLFDLAAAPSYPASPSAQSPFASTPRATASAASPFAAEPEPERRMTGQRHEDSVLFSLKSLGVVNFKDGDDVARAKVVEPAPSARAMPPLALGGASGTSPRDLDVPLPPPIVLPIRRGMSSGTKVAIALGVVALVGGGAALAYFLTRGDGGRGPAKPTAPIAAPTPAPMPPPSAPTPPPAVAVAPGVAAPGAAIAPTGVVAPTSAIAATPPPAAVEEEEEEVIEDGRRVKRKKKKKKPARETPSVAVASAPVAPPAPVPSPGAPEPAAAPEPETAPAPTPVPTPRAADSEVQAILEGRVAAPPSQTPTAKKDDALPDTLEKGQIKRVIRRNTSSIVRCYNTKVADKGTVKGSLNVTFTIFGTGRTGGIRVQRPDFWGSEFVGCAGNAVSRWKFPRFKGEEIEITYPFVLGGF